MIKEKWPAMIASSRKKISPAAESLAALATAEATESDREIRPAPGSPSTMAVDTRSKGKARLISEQGGTGEKGRKKEGSFKKARREDPPISIVSASTQHSSSSTEGDSAATPVSETIQEASDHSASTQRIAEALNLEIIPSVEQLMKAALRTARIEMLDAGEAMATNIQLGYRLLDCLTTELYSWKN